MTPLYQEENGVHVCKVSPQQKVYATDTIHDLTRNKAYVIEEIAYGDIIVKNDTGQRETYTSDWFSVTKLI